MVMLLEDLADYGTLVAVERPMIAAKRSISELVGDAAGPTPEPPFRNGALDAELKCHFAFRMGFLQQKLKVFDDT